MTTWGGETKRARYAYFDAPYVRIEDGSLVIFVLNHAIPSIPSDKSLGYRCNKVQ